MPPTAAKRCKDAASGMVCDDHAEVSLAAPGQMHRLIDEDVRVESVVHGDVLCFITARPRERQMFPRAIP